MPSAPLPILPAFSLPSPAAPIVIAPDGSLDTPDPPVQLVPSVPLFSPTGGTLAMFDATDDDPPLICYSSPPVGTLYSPDNTGEQPIYRVTGVQSTVLGYTVPLTLYRLNLVDIADPAQVAILAPGFPPITPGTVRPNPLPSVNVYVYSVKHPANAGAVAAAGISTTPPPPAAPVY